MHAKEMIETILTHVVDADYTVEFVHPNSVASIWISGHYHLDNGLIEDQLTLTLRTYFTIKQVVSTIEPDPDGWHKYSAMLTRKPYFAQVQNADAQ